MCAYFHPVFWHQMVRVTHKTPLFNAASASMKMFLYARCQYISRLQGWTHTGAYLFARRRVSSLRSRLVVLRSHCSIEDLQENISLRSSLGTGSVGWDCFIHRPKPAFQPNCLATLASCDTFCGSFDVIWHS